MIMRDVEIKEAIQKRSIVITPYETTRLKGASYDLTLGCEALVSKQDEKILLDKPGTHFTLNAGDFALVLTRETVKFPLDIAGEIGMRSSHARVGLILLHGMQVDPGYEGHLRFGLFNASPRKITLDYCDEICMIEFHKLVGAAETPARRNEDLVIGRIPESDRQFLRSLETTSLSDLATTVKSLSQSVQSLTDMLHKFVVPGIAAIFVAVVVAIIVAILKH